MINFFHSESTLLSQVWNIKTPNQSIFSAEKNPQNSEPQNGLRRGLDFIALVSLYYWNAPQGVPGVSKNLDDQTEVHFDELER